MGKKYKGSKAEVIALDSFIKLVRSGETITSGVQRWLAPRGMTVSRFGILEALLHLGPLCQKDIARKILKSGGNVTHVVDNLERDGLVARGEDAKDRRRAVVRLTEKGRALIEELFADHVQQVVRIMSPLTESELVMLSKLCKKLGTRQVHS